jgi:hypothetical protein
MGMLRLWHRVYAWWAYDNHEVQKTRCHFSKLFQAPSHNHSVNLTDSLVNASTKKWKIQELAPQVALLADAQHHANDPHSMQVRSLQKGQRADNCTSCLSQK